jgi:hypothetical protein
LEKSHGRQKAQRPATTAAALSRTGRRGRLGQAGRGEVVSKIWAYIKSNNLQNPANKREILADAKLKPVFDGKDKVSMFEMNKHLAKHLK